MKHAGPFATLLSITELMKHANSEAERNEYLGLIERCSLELDDIIRDSALKINNLEDEVNPDSGKKKKGKMLLEQGIRSKE